MSTDQKLSKEKLSRKRMIELGISDKPGLMKHIEQLEERIEFLESMIKKF